MAAARPDPKAEGASDAPSSDSAPPVSLRKPQADAPPPAPAATSAPTSFVVAPDRHITCRRGAVHPLEPIEPKDVGGEEHFAELVKSGAIIPKE